MIVSRQAVRRAVVQAMLDAADLDITVQAAIDEAAKRLGLAPEAVEAVIDAKDEEQPA